MNEARIAQYLDLIQRLLSCPRGEEAGILQAHRELWDEDFVLTLQAVAEQLRGEGQETGIEFLLQLAEQLAGALGMGEESDSGIPKDYLNFLIELLQTVSESRGNPQQVYPFLRQNLDKLDLQFVEVLTTWATNIFAQVEVNQAIDIAVVIGNLANRIQQFPLGNRLVNLEIGIACYEIILTVFTRENFPEDWAMTQNNLATAYSNRINGSRADNLERAIAFYEAALTVRTLEDFSEQWAMTQNNLATAYSDRINGSRADNLERAIAFYEAALTVRTFKDFPEDWAMTQNNLAAAYSDRINGSRADNLERAIAFYEAALTVRTFKDFPEDWAMTQNNLAAAYSNRINDSRADNLEQAIAFYEAALTVRTFEDFPEDWADTQSNLAVVHSDRINGSRADNLEQAIAFYEAALTVRTFEDFPEKWADTQNNLANAYSDRINGSRADNLEQAIASYKAALTVRTFEDFPEKWADTQNNLANAYSNRINGSRADNLERAIAFYEAALTVRTLEDFSEQWAMTQNNLATAYKNRINGSRADNVERAIELYKNALTIRTREAFPQDYIGTLWNLGNLYQREQQWQNAYDTYEPAIETVDFLRGKIQSGDETKQKLAEEWNRLYLGMVEVCIELAAAEPTYYTKAIEYAERSKARNLVELLATRDLYPKGDIPAPVIDQLSRLRREIDAEQRRLDNQRAIRNSDLNTGERSFALTTSPTGIDRAYLNQLQQQLSDLITHEISSIDPDFALTQEVKPIPYPEIQTLTGTNTAILEWYILNDKFLTFIITPQSPTPKVYQSSPEDFAALTAWRDRYLTDYRQENNKPWRDNLASRLQKLVEILHLKEILKQIPTQCDRLILIPHRFLHLFPIHALPIDSSQTLLDLFPQGVRYAPSCQLLQQAQNRQRPDFNHLFAIQNPTNDLLFTDLEVQAISQHFQPQDVLIQGDAQKSRIDDRRLQVAHCAHFSCHGYFNFAQPLLSALLLADCELTPPLPTEDPDRYLPLRDGNAIDLSKCLTLADIFALDFRSCRLVVLSACETGISDFQSVSDEYISLPSGFLVAGSSSVVPTLWAVSDLSTSFLMIKFYQLLKSGLSVAIALNSAQRWLRDATKEDLQAWTSQLSLSSTQRNIILPKLFNKMEANTKPFQSPYYWAAFCAVGQ